MALLDEEKKVLRRAPVALSPEMNPRARGLLGQRPALVGPPERLSGNRAQAAFGPAPGVSSLVAGVARPEAFGGGGSPLEIGTRGPTGERGPEFLGRQFREGLEAVTARPGEGTGAGRLSIPSSPVARTSAGVPVVDVGGEGAVNRANAEGVAPTTPYTVAGFTRRQPREGVTRFEDQAGNFLEGTGYKGGGTFNEVPAAEMQGLLSGASSGAARQGTAAPEFGASTVARPGGERPITGTPSAPMPDKSQFRQQVEKRNARIGIENEIEDLASRAKGRMSGRALASYLGTLEKSRAAQLAALETIPSEERIARLQEEGEARGRNIAVEGQKDVATLQAQLRQQGNIDKATAQEAIAARAEEREEEAVIRGEQREQENKLFREAVDPRTARIAYTDLQSRLGPTNAFNVLQDVLSAQPSLKGQELLDALAEAGKLYEAAQ